MKRLFLVLFIFVCASCSADKKQQDKEFIEQMERSTLSDVKVISYEKAD